ncbi:MAG: hypothetical protein ACRDHP_02075, partial [Ktedonobacterales bacterium]
YSAVHGATEPWTMHTECLLTGTTATSLDVTVRFLHLLTRSTAPTTPAPDAGTNTIPATPNVGAMPAAPLSGGRPSASGAIGWAPDSWEEGMEREIAAPTLTLGELVAHPQRVPFVFAAAHLAELDGDTPTRTVVRDQQALAGAFTVAAEPVESTSAGAFKLTVHIENTTPLHGAVPDTYNAAMLYALVSTHTIFQVRGGAFVSLLDPPEVLREAAGACRNERTYPVLVGDEGDTDTVLSSPIILYDYPKIAPESAGALFDGTEIDEILTLRILALTDEEKAEMRQGDERAREILDRTESLTAEQLMKLHGVIRSLGPASEGGGA